MRNSRKKQCFWWKYIHTVMTQQNNITENVTDTHCTFHWHTLHIPLTHTAHSTDTHCAMCIWFMLYFSCYIGTQHQWIDDAFDHFHFLRSLGANCIKVFIPEVKLPKYSLIHFKNFAPLPQSLSNLIINNWEFSMC